MIIYHGSYMELPKPDIFHSRKAVDFGQGFYTTPLYKQAEKWCRRFKDRRQPAIINRYTFDETAFEKCRVLRFDHYSEEWLDFILACRREEDSSGYDIVMGGVANDRVFNTIELFFDGLLDKKEALKRLRYEKPNFQIAFRMQTVLDQYLHFEGSERI